MGKKDLRTRVTGTLLANTAPAGPFIKDDTHESPGCRVTQLALECGSMPTLILTRLMILGEGQMEMVKIRAQHNHGP